MFHYTIICALLSRDLHVLNCPTVIPHICLFSKPANCKDLQSLDSPSTNLTNQNMLTNTTSAATEFWK